MAHKKPARVPPPSDLSGMEAIASGTHAAVRRWAGKLTRAGITSAVADSCERDPDRPDYAELWVGRGDADRARDSLGIGW